METPRGASFDGYSFTIAFKGVFLEGLEVVFIVLTFGATQHRIALSALVASVTLVVVAAVGVLVHRPLSRMPENTLKFIVGILLTSFGMFWSAEGAGVAWPGGESAIPVLIALMAGTAILFAGVLRRQHGRVLTPPDPAMTYLRRFGHFWYDFVVGDDWTVALGVVAALAVTWFVTHHGRNWFWLLPVAVVVLIAASLHRVRQRR